MKIEKIKRYRLSVRRTFTEDHPKAGDPTYFIEQIKNSLIEFSNEASCDNDGNIIVNKKLHTIRSNYSYWKNIMEKVQTGEAVIELFYWSGSPYNSRRDGSKQIVFAVLDKDSGCGVQELRFYYDRITEPFINTPEQHIGYIDKIELFAKHDGLSTDDFKAWFKSYDLHKQMAIIHFTSFRY